MKILRPFDLNCDMGEGSGSDELIMRYINTANIACGYHGGDVNTMYRTVELAVKHNVKVGAHVSWLDRANFGRIEMDLPEDDIYELVEQQLILMKEITDMFDMPLNHVKPHGALYNQSAKNKDIARAIARAVKDFDPRLILFGLSKSSSISEAAALGLKTANEVFADRRYQDDGSLVPRNQQGALIEDVNDVLSQLLQLVNEGTVTSVTGSILPLVVDTICIHGDGKNAALFAKAIFDATN